LKILDEARIPRFGIGVLSNLTRNLGLCCELRGTVAEGTCYDLELALFAVSHDQADLDALRFDGLGQLFQLAFIEDTAAVLGGPIGADGNGLKLVAYSVSSFLDSCEIHRSRLRIPCTVSLTLYAAESYDVWELDVQRICNG